jgi:hypothetical protein
MFSIFRKKKFYGYYVKSENGFKLLNQNGSINEISEYLGFLPFQIHSYHNPKKRCHIEAVGFEVFTENIVFVLVNDISKKVTNKRVGLFLKDFKFEEEYDSIFVRDFLLEGIANKTLDIDFMSRVLKLPNQNPNEEFHVRKLGVKLFFVNGFLASFKLTNDLEEWARYFKTINKELIANYAKVAKKYWNDNYEMIFNEVNTQSEALANTPSGYRNEYTSLHKGEFNTVNFLMLLVCHYGQRINEFAFLQLNHGRYELEKDDYFKVYRLGSFLHYFDKMGVLIKSEKINKKVSRTRGHTKLGFKWLGKCSSRSKFSSRLILSQLRNPALRIAANV